MKYSKPPTMVKSKYNLTDNFIDLLWEFSEIEIKSASKKEIHFSLVDFLSA